MPTSAVVDDPQYWKERAEEARRLAGQLLDPQSKQIMQEIASSYDQLAKSAENRRARKPAD